MCIFVNQLKKYIILINSFLRYDNHILTYKSNHNSLTSVLVNLSNNVITIYVIVKSEPQR